MPQKKIRLLLPVLSLLSGCASPGLFSGFGSHNKAADSAGGQAVAHDPANDPARQTAWTARPGTPDGRNGAWTNPYANRSPADLLADSEQSRQTGNLTSARLACEQALRLNPFDLDAKYQLARISDDEGRFAEAERGYVEILKQKPGDADVLTSLGWSYYLQGRFDESERCLRQVLQKDPQHQVALNDLGFVYGARGNLDAAWNCFRAAGSEAQAQQAMAMLTQNGVQGPVQANAEDRATGENRNPMTLLVDRNERNVPETPPRKNLNDAQFPTPQAKKLAEDFQRLKAENEKQQQQQRRAKQESQRMSAPSPWNDDRKGDFRAPRRDVGAYPPAGVQDRGIPYGHGVPGNNPGAQNFYPGPGQPGFVPNDAAFPGAAPSQANRPGTADPGNFAPPANVQPAETGFQTGATQFPRSGQASHAIYEQAQAGQRPQLPIITPGTSRNDSAAENQGYTQSLNSLPPQDNSFTPLPGTGNVTAEHRVPEWSNGPGGRNPSDRTNQPAGGTPGPQSFQSAPPRSRNPWNDAQAEAAQVGLNAGPGGMGITTADWTTQQGGLPAAGGRAPQNTNLQPGSAPSGNLWNQPAGDGTAGGSRQPGTQQSGSRPGGGAQPGQQNYGRPPAYQGRPLSSGIVPQAVVPSAQGRVYGATDDFSLNVSPPANPSNPPQGRSP
ncbi:MAG: tetratricopeptide repeat protein [Planctomycetia bacterium]|nr:tetratricopeptide repeat protein [Planctomycetia bacterium]